MFQTRPTPAHTPFLIASRTLGHADLEEQLLKVAARLIASELQHKRVLLVVRDDLAFPPLLLGCMRAGAIPLLLDPGTSVRQIRDLLEHTHIDGVIADADAVDLWRAEDVPLPAQQIRVGAVQAKGALLSKLLGRRAPADLENWPGLLSAPAPTPLPPARQEGPPMSCLPPAVRPVRKAWKCTGPPCSPTCRRSANITR